VLSDRSGTVAQNGRVSDPLSRRAFVLRSAAATLAVPLVALLGGRAAAASPSLPGVRVRPRSDWAAGLSAPGELAQEAPGDVRMLVVHHSASPNGYAANEVPEILRGFHAFHTGAAKGWPDVAYNFFVDAFGTVWEGRAGSLAGPVRPDATGGSQGWSQICCFVGDHSSEPPTAAAQTSMTALLAALADRYAVEPGTTTTFVSRGSNKWPAGVSVTTATIAGHRDVSLTSCPGDAAYALVERKFPRRVAALLAARATPSPVAATWAPATAAPTSAAPAPSLAAAPSDPARAARSTEPPAAAAGDRAAGSSTAQLVTGGAVASGAVAVLARFLRRRPPSGESPPG
jgi:hypothetical protein